MRRSDPCKLFKAWFREHGDTDAGAAVSFSGSFGAGNISVAPYAGPASGTPVNTVSGTSSPSAANVNTTNGISINIYNNGEFVGVNSIYSQLSNSFGNYYGNAQRTGIYLGNVQLSLGYVQNNPVNRIDPSGLFDSHQFLTNTSRDAYIFAGGAALTFTPPGEAAALIFGTIAATASMADAILYPSDPVITSLAEIAKAAMRVGPPFNLGTDALIDFITDPLKKRNKPPYR